MKTVQQRSWTEPPELEWRADEPGPGAPGSRLNRESDVGAERWSPWVLWSLQPGLRRKECPVSSVSWRTGRTVRKSLTPDRESNRRGNHLKHRRDQVFPKGVLGDSGHNEWAWHMSPYSSVRCWLTQAERENSALFQLIYTIMDSPMK